MATATWRGHFIGLGLDPDALSYADATAIILSHLRQNVTSEAWGEITTDLAAAVADLAARRAEIESGEIGDDDSLSEEQWQFLMDHAGLPAPPPSDDLPLMVMEEE